MVYLHLPPWRRFDKRLTITELSHHRSFSTTPRSPRTYRTTGDGLTRRYICIYTYRSTVVVTTCYDLGTFLISVVIQIELLAELVGKRCCTFLVAQRAKEIEIPLDTSTSGGSKAISAAVIGQTSTNLSHSDGLVKNRDKTSPKHEADAFKRILAGKIVPAAHPFGRLNSPTQFDPTLFQHGQVFMQIWFHDSMNQPIEDNCCETLHDNNWQDYLSRLEINFQREYFLTHGRKNTGNRSINGSTPGLKNPGIGIDYLMAVIYVIGFRNQRGVAACKDAPNKTDD